MALQFQNSKIAPSQKYQKEEICSGGKRWKQMVQLPNLWNISITKERNVRDFWRECRGLGFRKRGMKRVGGMGVYMSGTWLHVVTPFASVWLVPSFSFSTFGKLFFEFFLVKFRVNDTSHLLPCEWVLFVLFIDKQYIY